MVAQNPAKNRSIRRKTSLKRILFHKDGRTRSEERWVWRWRRNEGFCVRTPRLSWDNPDGDIAFQTSVITCSGNGIRQSLVSKPDLPKPQGVCLTAQVRMALTCQSPIGTSNTRRVGIFAHAQNFVKSHNSYSISSKKLHKLYSLQGMCQSQSATVLT